ncbi:hypothetical protein BLNAU_14572 [Blattamonas nauphoetae]|uniref:Uncharacterized protein n=1 Tax=Blattamonas nauphoetae TaxID=2049346 RepID=A0ABQ9XHZ0_9EUKA|nr:hypothetical protein BLNAU_14572 [Blattamonas nauphoetae]
MEKCTTPIPHISPPVSIASDEDRLLTLRHSQPQIHSRKGPDCRSLTSAEPAHVIATAYRQNIDTADLAACHIVSAIAAILAGHPSHRPL